MVATYHYAPPLYGFHQGIIAVVSFILISGYVMTLLIEKYYTGNIAHFYLDRLARLLPQFLFYSLLVLLLMSLSPLGEDKLSWMEFSTCTNTNIALNFSMFINNFYTYFKSCLFIPQSWSLGLEAFFYLVIPFIIIFISNNIRLFLAVISCLIFITGYLGLIDFNLWSYRYLPGTLFIFLTGSSIARPDKYPRYFTVIVFGIALILLILVKNDMHYYNIIKGTLAGILAGIPMLIMASRIKSSSFDTFLGNLSYGVFLNHIIFLWLIEGYHITKYNYTIFIMLLASCALSYISFTLIEKPTIGLRKRLRIIV